MAGRGGGRGRCLECGCAGGKPSWWGRLLVSNEVTTRQQVADAAAAADADAATSNGEQRASKRGAEVEGEDIL